MEKTQRDTLGMFSREEILRWGTAGQREVGWQFLSGKLQLRRNMPPCLFEGSLAPSSPSLISNPHSIWGLSHRFLTIIASYLTHYFCHNHRGLWHQGHQPLNVVNVLGDFKCPLGNLFNNLVLARCQPYRSLTTSIPMVLTHARLFRILIISQTCPVEPWTPASDDLDLAPFLLGLSLPLPHDTCSLIPDVALFPQTVLLSPCCLIPFMIHPS